MASCAHDGTDEDDELAGADDCDAHVGTVEPPAGAEAAEDVVPPDHVGSVVLFGAIGY